ncbi:hypothetical protein CLU79DRAFT_772494 [Phycomyces nitens]|nr:hypothetical protein CLU79DRAFT_772494 [Phycomyces nitens]
MESTYSSDQYKVVEYNDQLFMIPIRRVNRHSVLLFSDVQALVPSATALVSMGKLIPFERDPSTLVELEPRRVMVSDLETTWEAFSPEQQTKGTNRKILQKIIDLESKIDMLTNNLNNVLNDRLNNESEPSPSAESRVPLAESPTECEIASQSTSPLNHSTQDNSGDITEEEDNDDDNDNDDNNEAQDNQEPQEQMRQTPPLTHGQQRERSQSPPPAFSSSAHVDNAPQSSSAAQPPTEGDAPPSYETSIFGSIKALMQKLHEFERHIPNRHKSPRWLVRRVEWVERVPNSIEQVAYQIVQLEMALLWTAVTEAWINERETWLTLVASARSERHLAGALLSLERHTLAMDDQWAEEKEHWVNALLEMVVLPLSHG